MKLVSIVTPSFNQAQYLEETLRSVLEQDYPSLEYIVVDGSSTDGSVEIIRKYSDRLAWWVSEKDRGQGDAINKGLEHAHGEIIAWLNSDDTYLPHTIASAVQIFEQNPDVVLVYGDMLAVDAHSETINVLRYRQLSLEDLLCFQIIGQPAVFFRRDAYEKTGGLDTSFHFMLDHHLWIRHGTAGENFACAGCLGGSAFMPRQRTGSRPAGFGPEAFRILDWAKGQPELTETVCSVEDAPTPLRTA